MNDISLNEKKDLGHIFEDGAKLIWKYKGTFGLLFAVFVLPFALLLTYLFISYLDIAAPINFDQQYKLNEETETISILQFIASVFLLFSIQPPLVLFFSSLKQKKPTHFISLWKMWLKNIGLFSGATGVLYFSFIIVEFVLIVLMSMSVYIHPFVGLGLLIIYVLAHLAIAPLMLFYHNALLTSILEGSPFFESFLTAFKLMKKNIVSIWIGNFLNGLFFLFIAVLFYVPFFFYLNYPLYEMILELPVNQIPKLPLWILLCAGLSYLLVFICQYFVHVFPILQYHSESFSEQEISNAGIDDLIGQIGEELQPENSQV